MQKRLFYEVGIATNANMTQGHIFNGTFHNNSLGVSLARFHTKALYLSSKMSPHFSNNIKVNIKTSIISKSSVSNLYVIDSVSWGFKAWF